MIVLEILGVLLACLLGLRYRERQLEGRRQRVERIRWYTERSDGDA